MTDDYARHALMSARTLAVLGAHHDPTRPAFYVPHYLHHQGYRILPINPALAGQSLWGEPVRSSLGEAVGADLVIVFRQAAALPGHLVELLAYGRLVWLQTGIVNVAVAASLAQAGIPVVMDRCAMVDHRRWS